MAKGSKNERLFVRSLRKRLRLFGISSPKVEFFDGGRDAWLAVFPDEGRVACSRRSLEEMGAKAVEEVAALEVAELLKKAQDLSFREEHPKGFTSSTDIRVEWSSDAGQSDRWSSLSGPALDPVELDERLERVKNGKRSAPKKVSARPYHVHWPFLVVLGLIIIVVLFLVFFSPRQLTVPAAPQVREVVEVVERVRLENRTVDPVLDFSSYVDDPDRFDFRVVTVPGRLLEVVELEGEIKLYLPVLTDGAGNMLFLEGLSREDRLLVPRDEPSVTLYEVRGLFRDRGDRLVLEVQSLMVLPPQVEEVEVWYNETVVREEIVS